jgi:hypothetical protein
MKMLIVSALCAGSLFAGDHSQKTFLMPRAAGTNKAMEYSIWHHHLYSKFDHKHSINTHLALTPFYQASTNDEDLGKYFGIGNCKTPKCIKFGDPSDTSVDLDSSFFIHNVDPADSTLIRSFPTGTIQLCPEQEVYGFRMDFFQSMNCPVKGLFFKASLPFLHVKNDTKIKFKKCGDENKVTIGCHEASMLDFFSGRVNIASDLTDDVVSANLQAPLKKGKISCSRSAQGVADLELMLGWKFLHNDKYHGFISAGVVVPTGNKVRGEYLFEPIYGNGDHFGLHVELDAGARLWKGEQGALKALAAVSYRYLFSGTEMRTLGLKNICLTSVENTTEDPETVRTTGSKKFGHYALGGRKDQKNEQLFPLANVLSPNLRVKPGSQIDAQMWLSFQNSCFIVDVGYNLFWKDEESLSLKKCSGFENDTYAIADPRFVVIPDTGAPEDSPEFNLDEDGIIAAGTTFINECNLCFDAAKTPSQLTHKIFGALGWHFNLCTSYPTSLSVGGSYEFASDNSALEQWAVWAKAAFSF